MRRYIAICLFIVCAALQGFAEVIGRPVMQTVADEARIYKLWYDEPAQVWTEALPLGNGRLGAMVYGTPAMENIQLNEETLWADVRITMPTLMLWSIFPRCVNWCLRASILKRKRLPPKR